VERLGGSELQRVGEALESINGEILNMANDLHGKAQKFRRAAQQMATVARTAEAGHSAAIGRIALAFTVAARHCDTAAGALTGASRDGQAYVRQTVVSAVAPALGGAALSGAARDAGANEATASAWMTTAGLADVDVAIADYSDNPIEGTWARHGLTRDDYKWAIMAWDGEVRPGLDRGMTRDDFASADAARDAQPTRRYQDVYDMFLGHDPIMIDLMPDGRLHVGSGRHRIEIAREFGIPRLPAKWSG
jgi:hypothetical protein